MDTASSASLTKKDEQSETGRRSQLAAGFTISLFTIILCLGLLELVAYGWERSTAQDTLGWTLVASRRMPLERHGSEERPYYLFVPERQYNWEGVPVHINARGLRNETVEIPKPEKTYRILNIGDSVAFGWEVNYEETYGQQFEQMLNERDDGLQYEVINAGVPGWTLEMERDFLLQEGLDYEPDMILLDITLVNDVYGKGPAVSENPDLFAWLRDHTHSWPFLTTQARFLMARQRGPEAIPVLNPPQEASAYYPLDEDNPTWDRIWEPILAIHEIAQEHDIRLVVVAFPTAFQLNSAAHPDTPQRVLASRTAAAGIEYIDLLPVYGAVCEEAGIDACEGYENLLFADVWMHPNALGHQLVAEALNEIK